MRGDQVPRWLADGGEVIPVWPIPGDPEGAVMTMHVRGWECWCAPTVETVALAEGDVPLIVHHDRRDGGARGRH